MQSYSWDTFGGGNLLTIYHPSLGIRTAYAHLSSSKVKSGDSILKGQVIAFSGNSGTLTTGAHLHFTVIMGQSGAWAGNTINPIDKIYSCATTTTNTNGSNTSSSSSVSSSVSISGGNSINRNELLGGMTAQEAKQKTDRLKELTDSGDFYSNEYNDLVNGLSNGLSIKDIITEAKYKDSNGVFKPITIDMWKNFIENKSNLDSYTEIVIKNIKWLGTLNDLIVTVSVAISVYEDYQNYDKNTQNGLLPIRNTLSTLSGIASGNIAVTVIGSVCTAVTGGGCLIVAAIGGLVVGVGTQIGVGYYFERVLTRENIDKVVNDFKGNIPVTKIEEYNLLLNLQCIFTAWCGGTNPYKLP